MAITKRFTGSRLLLIFAALTAICGCGLTLVGLLISLSPPMVGRMRESTSSAGHFTISYPENWDFLQHPGGQRDPTIVAAIAHPNLFKLGVIVFIRQSTSQYDSIDGVSKWGEEIAQQEQDYQEILMSELFLTREETGLREYRWYTPATPLQSPQLMQCYGSYRLHNQIGYVLTLCVNAEDFPAAAPTFRQMIENFTYSD